ncbi:MAG: putative 4-hydroxybenzoate polyprenyltransferase [Desulfobacteraceae bacterium]|nr:putative 4-hydroxybenzoate polyprenyltransferase [Desulfobacteraceae bacterium]
MDFRRFSELILVRQTLFALPFAWLGILFAGGGPFQTWLWVTAALAAARTAGMAFNQVIDAGIDAQNPRTKNRPVARGDIHPAAVWALAGACVLVLVFAARMLNPLCFYLSFPAALMLFAYSYCKRFWAGSHFFLGAVEAAAPVGGYLAVTGRFEILALLPGAVILTWIAGLDIVYAIQDAEFDRDYGLYSIPARLGKKNALLLSAACYATCLAAMVLTGMLTHMGFLYLAAICAIAVIFARQQILARKKPVGPAIRTIFWLNMWVAPILLLGAAADVLRASF